MYLIGFLTINLIFLDKYFNQNLNLNHNINYERMNKVLFKKNNFSEYFT